MAVKVTSGSKVTNDSRGNIVTQHPDATGLDVKDGHLLVTVGTGASPDHRVAVYAPGNWISAEVVK
jgi:hypothetical protein